MFINITKSADAGLLAIADYLAQDDFDEAERVVRAVVEAVYSLQKFPHRGRPGRVGGTLEFLVPGLPYILVYAVMENEIRMLQVLHQKQQWPQLQVAP